MEVDHPPAEGLATSLEETGKPEKEVVQLPQKKYYRQRAHSNPICDHIFD